jgi:AcrR family transcriptional regulator
VRTKTPNLTEKMLEAAGRLFGEHRFHEVRMEDIATEAGVSKGTLYRYFHDKQEMYLALLEHASHQLVAELKSQSGLAHTNRDRLIAVVATFLTFFDERRHLLDLIQRAEVGQDKGGAFPWQDVRNEGMRIVLDILEDGQRNGEFRISDPNTSMLMLLGGLRAVLRFGDKPIASNLAEQIVDGFLHGALSSHPALQVSAN